MPIARLSALLAPITLALAATVGWGQCLEQRIENPSPTERASFGAGVWIEDGTLLVGGARGLYVYGFDGRVWSLEQTLPRSASPWNDWTDFDGQRIIGGGSREASIYVRQGDRFELEQRIEQPHPDAYSFGRSTAIEGDVAVVAESDVADIWVYNRGPDGWRQVQFLDLPPGLIEFTTYPRYAHNLELDDGWLFISASTADRAGVRRAGVVVAYRLQPDGTFANPQVIASPSPVAIEEINKPTMRNGVLAVTSRGVDPDGQTQVVAHTFRLEGETWVYDQAVRGAGVGDRLYATIALSPDAGQMLVSTPDQGRVYAFERDASGRYQQVARVGGGSGLNFQYAGLASDGRHAYVGAPNHYAEGVAEVGAVAIVDVLCERCTADLNGDGRADTADLLAFLNFYEMGDPIADFDGDGVLTAMDLDVFQTALDAGCPPLPTGCQPTLVETITGFGAIGDVIVEGTLAYAHTSERGFVILDVRDPAAPVEIASLPAAGPFDYGTIKMAKRGSLVFISAEGTGVAIIDVAEPAEPRFVSTLALAHEFYDMTLSGDTLLAARYGARGSYRLDVSDPRRPIVVDQFTRANDYAGGPGVFYAATGYELEAGALAVLDAESLDVLATVAVRGEALSVAVDDRDPTVVYTQSNNFRGPPPVGNFLTAFDVSDPTRPVILGIGSLASRFDFEVRHGYAYIADRSGVYVMDVRDPADIARLHFLPYPSRDVAIIGHHLWAFGDDANLYVVDIATCLPCRADLDGDGRATVYDILEFIALYQAGSPSADFNQDGQINVVDMLGFQQAVRAGCE